jgi:hypothetical protein
VSSSKEFGFRLQLCAASGPGTPAGNPALCAASGVPGLLLAGWLAGWLAGAGVQMAISEFICDRRRRRAGDEE